MDWWVLVTLGVVAIFFMMRSSKVAEEASQRAEAASKQLREDTRLQEHIKVGMCEYEWRARDDKLWGRKHKEMLFETALLTAYYVEHFAEFRIGFYFKDIQEFGMYSHFSGNGDDNFESYYRSDLEFEKQQRLITLDD